MTVLKAIVRDGKIELDAPQDWPDGTEVRIEPLPVVRSSGLHEEDWPDTPEGLAGLIASMDRIEPLDITAEEQAEWDGSRDARKSFEEARFDEHAEALRKGWE